MELWRLDARAGEGETRCAHEGEGARGVWGRESVGRLAPCAARVRWARRDGGSMMDERLIPAISSVVCE